MYFTFLLLISASITFFMASKIANFFLAERPEVKWIVFASLASAFIAVIAFVGLNFIVAGIDLSATDSSQTLMKRYPTVMLVVTISILLLLSSVSFKVINKMGWGAALATNIASVGIILAISFGASSLLSDKKVMSKPEMTNVVAPAEEGIIVKGESIAKLLTPQN
ncbi:MAG: hypothetical protein V3U64_02040 [Cocleimonas sp.]